MPTDLFSPVTFGALTAKNRIFMAPLTRGRAEPGTPVPSALQAEYYAQRASAGLIVTEATAISPQGYGWLNAPGVWTDGHVEGWKRTTEAVHDNGGLIFLQLWHMGRVSHPSFQEGGALPVGPSAIAAPGGNNTPVGKAEYVVPRALEASELPGIVADYAAAAKRAIAAGFDGVEIHGANGYLLDQFMKESSNQRTDDYGGSFENRWRFPLQVVAAVVEAVGADRTGIPLSPAGGYNGMSDSDPVGLYSYGAEQLDKHGLAYLHIVGAPDVLPHIRSRFSRLLIHNGGYDRATGDAVIAEGGADAIAFGTKFLANPDLPARFSAGADLNPLDFSTAYTPGSAGYTDYPTLEQPGT